MTLKWLWNFHQMLLGILIDENNLPYNSLLTNTQVSKLRKAFAKGSSASINLTKTQLH